MADSWEGILDILELSQNVRAKANLKVLKEFHLGYPEESLLLELYEFMKILYELEDNYFSIVWFEQSQNNPDISYLKKKLVGKDDVKFIQNLWLTLSGNYILFLPKTFDTNIIGNGDEEEVVGRILSAYGQLLLKTPDGNEILYIYLNKDQ
ncbi:hypothetical protein RB620_04705 [Paenibacillus sp. LHD-117]|uniref:hypothetical protein n=1 Tax=Paenibacillus sp. LHD-117 TaxID=3071412 RepID=UPI0027DFFBDE|nr:hypothetical protein [Paenibacillus sp. LHD-117]MDQ6418734.1 hypothetical protein [Paenibacillus sp. LHD-117]